MTPTDQAVLDHLRMRLDIARREKEQALARLRIHEIEDARIRKQIQDAFPGEEAHGPAVNWDDLSLIEQHVVHFIALRGRIYRIPDLLPAFSASSGATLSEFAFRHHLTGLGERGVLLRAHPGWAVHQRFVLKAREPLERMRPRSGMEEMGRRMKVVSQASWNPGSSTRRRKRGDLPPALQALLDTTPADRAFTTDDVMDAPGGRDRITSGLRRLVEERRLVKLSPGVYARSGVEIKAVPLPAQLRGALAALPTDRAISLSDWAQAATASTSQEAIDAMSARAAVLKRQGRIQEVGKGLYKRKEKALPPAEPIGELPSDLRVFLALVPEREDSTLSALGVAMDGERTKASGQVFRLVQRGLLERSGVQTYRRVRSEVAPEIGLLRHFEVGVVLRAVEVVRKEEGRITASGLVRMNANLAELVVVEKLEKVEDGFRLRAREKVTEKVEEPAAGLEVEVVGTEPAEVAPQPMPVVRCAEPAPTLTQGGEMAMLTAESAVEGRVDLARVLWALEWCMRNGHGPVNATEIARICTEEGGVKVHGPNIGRFLRECREKGTYAGMWVTEGGRYRAS